MISDLAAILERCPELRAADQLIREFAAMLTNRTGNTTLTSWITAATIAGLPGITTFAEHLTADLDTAPSPAASPWRYWWDFSWSTRVAAHSAARADSPCSLPEEHASQAPGNRTDTHGWAGPAGDPSHPARTGADERHIVIPLDQFNEQLLQPALCFEDGICPTRPPNLQAGVDALWLCRFRSASCPYRGVYWRPGGGWQTVEWNASILVD